MARVRGDKHVAKALRELARHVSGPIGTTSRFALRPALAAARRNVKALDFEDSTGALQESLGIAKSGRGKVKQTFRVGPRKDFEKDGRKPIKYAHLLEFGTRHSRSFAFLEPAYKETKDEVFERYKQRFPEAMEKRARQIAARQSKTTR